MYDFMYRQPFKFRPHSYFVDFTSRTLFYIMTSLPVLVKAGKTPGTQNLALEPQAHGAWISFPPPPFSLLPPFFR